jgi:hypothetical protein
MTALEVAANVRPHCEVQSCSALTDYWALPSREVIVDQGGTNSYNLVGANRRADTASTNRHSALYFAGGYSFGQRDHEIGIIVARIKVVSAEIENVMSAGTKQGNNFFFQSKSAMVCSNSQTHVFLLEQYVV